MKGRFYVMYLPILIHFLFPLFSKYCLDPSVRFFRRPEQDFGHDLCWECCRYGYDTMSRKIFHYNFLRTDKEARAKYTALNKGTFIRLGPIQMTKRQADESLSMTSVYLSTTLVASPTITALSFLLSAFSRSCSHDRLQIARLITTSAIYMTITWTEVRLTNEHISPASQRTLSKHQSKTCESCSHMHLYTRPNSPQTRTQD
jgi:hypothetical protein